MSNAQLEDHATATQQHGLSAPTSPPSSEEIAIGTDETDPNRKSRILARLLKHPALDGVHHITGPLSGSNPTRANIAFSKLGTFARKDVYYKWTSRNNRKGRHAIAVTATALRLPSRYQIPSPTNYFRQICRAIWRMLSYYPVWDVSYDVATVFTLGSVVWVINAFFVYLPLVRPETEFKNEILIGGGVTACVGATIFVLGSVLLVVEAVNDDRTPCFGWQLERAVGTNEEKAEKAMERVRFRPAEEECTHHHGNKRNLVGKGAHTGETEEGKQSWVWWPSWGEMRDHYFHEIGFLASFVQLVAASIFEISGITALPGINNNMSSPILIIFYWTPQIIGGTGFIISGLLFMIETQTRWYVPAFGTLGWWIGAWNLIGGVGFTLCPAFGYNANHWAQYQASLSTFWGSWSFLIGSVLQWYESLVKYPIEVIEG